MRIKYIYISRKNNSEIDLINMKILKIKKAKIKKSINNIINYLIDLAFFFLFAIPIEVTDKKI